MNKENGGIRLGLAICKDLIEMMGGKIWLVSNVNRGSTFIFNLPVQTDHGEAPKPLIPLKHLVGEAKKEKILIAEDDEVSKILIVNVLKKVNYDIVTARNGREALDKYMQDDYRLILMDLSMPKMDGFQVTERIRKIESEKGCHTPIIALSAHAFPETKRRCDEVGMDDYITKPINMHDLLQKVVRLLLQEALY